MTFSQVPPETTANSIPLRLGLPDPTTLLTPELSAAMQRVISSPQMLTALQYGPEQGTQNLISVLVEKINREQPLSLEPTNLMITAGSTHAVDLLARLYAKPGGVVLAEAPTFADALHIFQDQQIEIRSVAMDEDGLLPSALEQQIAQLRANNKAPAFLYT